MLLEGNLQGLQHLGLPTADINTTKTWYQEVLGFETVHEAVLQEHGGETKVAFLKLDNLIIETYQQPEHVRKEAGIDKDGYVEHIALNVRDVDAAFKEITAAGIEVLEGAPRFLPFWDNGVRFFTIRGPNREKIEFNQYL